MKFRSFISSQSGINHAMKQMLTLDVTKGYLFTLEEHEEPIPKGERMPQTPEYFQRIMDMAEEIIFERNAEISKLKSKVNDLENKLRSKK